MKAPFDPHANKHASVYANDDFLCVRSYAGHSRVVGDRTVAFLPRDASNTDIGNAVETALSAYRVISLGEMPEFFDRDRVAAAYADWEKDLCARAGYTSTRKLYNGMRLVLIRASDSELVVSATARRRGPAFEGNGFSITVEAKSGPAAIGQAVKTALEESA